MKAYIYEQDNKGQSKLGTGRISPEYKNLKNLKKFYLDKLPKGNYNVELFYNWDNRYGKPNQEFTYTVQ